MKPTQEKGHKPWQEILHRSVKIIFFVDWNRGGGGKMRGATKKKTRKWVNFSNTKVAEFFNSGWRERRENSSHASSGAKHGNTE